MATKADLRNRAMQEIRKLGVGAPASPEDAVDVDIRLDNINELLVVKNIATWGDDVTLMGKEAQEPFVILLAARIGPMFGLGRTDQEDIDKRAIGALRELRELSSMARSGEPVQAVYY